jgi:hypothetical protein
MKNKPPTKEEARKRIVDAIEAGRVEYAHPRAAEMLQTPHLDGDEKGELEYLDAAIVKPFHCDADDARAPWQHEGGVQFQWGIKGFGFGEASIVFRNGRWIADTERLGRKFLQKLVERWVKQMAIDQPAQESGKK